MAAEIPVTELHAGFSSPGASPTDWAEGRRLIEAAEVFWLSTVRPDGRPHVTPLLSVWHDDAMCFCTGPAERKAENLKQNPQCILTTGENGLDGLDVVVEGCAAEVGDAAGARPDRQNLRVEVRGALHRGKSLMTGTVAPGSVGVGLRRRRRAALLVAGGCAQGGGTYDHRFVV